ncbi:MAG: CoA-binding protein [Paucimonas sp.]|jgi:predicted CoA-binding protein|nr:CoA-binding protein [Paucimonas sp.]
MTCDSLIPGILRDARTVAIVGLSDKPERDSYEVAEYLQHHGYRIIPVNPANAGSHILGEHCYATLKEAGRDLGEQGVVVDVVDCFRKPEAVTDLARQAVEIGATTLWMPLGVVNEEAARIAREAGLKVVMDRCMKIEHGLLPH